MADNTAIEWTHRPGTVGETWNPTTGCDKISPGCGLPRWPGDAKGGCYAMTMAKRLKAMGQEKYQTDGDPRTSGPGFGVAVHEDALTIPQRWRKPRTVFVNSMSDLGHARVPREFVARVFAVMAATPQHTYQILSKRPERMARMLEGAKLNGFWDAMVKELLLRTGRRGAVAWPLPNVWIGTSIELDEYAHRADRLRETPAAVRFISAEPLLGPLPNLDLTGIHWLIAGGESGPDARPMHPDWVRNLRDRCAAADVPFFFKQWGEWLPVAVEDDPQFSGGRAFNCPRGGRAAAAIRERSTRPYTSGITRPMRAGDINGHGHMLDNDTIAVRVGKKDAGRELDGRTWDEYPEPVTAGGVR